MPATPATPVPAIAADEVPTVPRRMRAVLQDRYGGTDVLRLGAADVPAIAADEVLLEVRASGVDRGVWHLMTGMPYLVRLAGYGLTRPAQPVPGLDVVGRVVAVGAEVTRFQPGDAVFGIASGAYAEYAAAEEITLAHLPPGVPEKQAAVAPISGITALQAVEDVADVQAGQSVLVIGASGGVGTSAVQLAKARGATVTGVSSGAKTDLVRDLGADAVIDHTTSELVGTYDVILDIGGRTPLRRLRRHLTSTGTLVIIGGEGGNRLTGGVGRQLRALLLSPFVGQRLTTFISTEHHALIERLAAHITAGTLTPVVDRVVALSEVPAAIEDLAAGRVRGKLAVDVALEARG